TEKFEIGEGVKKEEARFRPLLALEGSVTKFGATTMDGTAVSALAGKGASAKVNYVATDRTGRSVLTKTLAVKDAPGDILAGSVATQTDTAAPWTVTNTSRNSVRFVYRVPAPLRAVDGPGEGNFILAPGETRTICSITSTTAGTYPIEYAQAALAPAGPDLLTRPDDPEELIWQGGPAQGPVVFDTAAGAAGELVEGSKRLPLELSGYTASPLKTADLNDAPGAVATGEKSSVGGFGEMAPFAIGGLGALLAVGPNLLKGRTTTGEEVETLFAAVPAELPAAALAKTKRADGVVAVAVDNTDLWKALGMAPLKPDVYPNTTNIRWGGKRYEGGDLVLEGSCQDVREAGIVFLDSSSGQPIVFLDSHGKPTTVVALKADAIAVTDLGAERRPNRYQYTIPSSIVPPKPANSSFFRADLRTWCEQKYYKDVTETYRDGRPGSGGSAVTGGGAPGPEQPPPKDEKNEVIVAGNTSDVKTGGGKGGKVAGGKGGEGGASGDAKGGKGGDASGGQGGSPEAGDGSGGGGTSVAGSSEVGVGAGSGSEGSGGAKSTGGPGTSQGGSSQGGQGGKGGEADGGAGESGDASGGKGGGAGNNDTSAEGGNSQISPQIEINKKKQTAKEDVDLAKEQTKQKELDLEMAREKTRQQQSDLETAREKTRQMELELKLREKGK
ncbi:MAG: hypothetical protein RDV41_08705, partial [Planctomycetota bacterium]|nr:hypothetical protein [Planctomycetota bacterium]